MARDGNHLSTKKKSSNNKRIENGIHPLLDKCRNGCYAIATVGVME